MNDTHVALRTWAVKQDVEFSLEMEPMSGRYWTLHAWEECKKALDCLKGDHV